MLVNNTVRLSFLNPLCQSLPLIGVLIPFTLKVTTDFKWGFPGGTSGKEPACQCNRHEIWVQSLGWEDSLEERIATHSSILVWRIPWTEEPGGYSP